MNQNYKNKNLIKNRQNKSKINNIKNNKTKINKIKKINKPKFILLIVIGILIVILGLLLVQQWSYYSVEEVKVLEMDAYVSNENIGFNLDKDKVHFGTANPGTLVSRNIQLTSSGRDYALKVTITNDGSIADYLIMKIDGEEFVNKAEFVINPDESKDINFIFSPESDAPEGKYQGTSKIVFKRKLFS